MFEQMGWIIAGLALMTTLVQRFVGRWKQQVVLEETVSGLVRKLSEVVDQANAHQRQMTESHKDFWEDKWPRVERAIAALEHLDHRVTALEERRRG